MTRRRRRGRGETARSASEAERARRLLAGVASLRLRGGVQLFELSRAMLQQKFSIIKRKKN